MYLHYSNQYLLLCIFQFNFLCYIHGTLLLLLLPLYCTFHQIYCIILKVKYLSILLDEQCVLVRVAIYLSLHLNFIELYNLLRNLKQCKRLSWYLYKGCDRVIFSKFKMAKKRSRKKNSLYSFLRGKLLIKNYYCYIKFCTSLKLNLHIKLI